MRLSWVPIFVGMIGIGCGAFALFPGRWAPDLSQGILAGMAMYFVAFSRTVVHAHSTTGQIPPLFGPRGIIPRVAWRAAWFLVVLSAIAYVYFDRRTFWDVTWPVLILAAWGLADGMLQPRRVRP